MSRAEHAYQLVGRGGDEFDQWAGEDADDHGQPQKHNEWDDLTGPEVIESGR